MMIKKRGHLGKKAGLLLVILISLSIPIFCYSHTTISKGDIPENIPADVKQQIERLYSSDIEEQVRACYKLSQMGERAMPAVPFLIGLLGSKYLFEEMSPDEAAAKALVKIGKPAVPQLINCLKDEDPWTRERVVWVLGRIKDHRSADVLIAALKDDDSDVRWIAALALGELKDKRSVEGLIDALNDKYQNVRKEAASSLGAIADKRAAEPLIKTLKDEIWKVRAHAAEALGNIKDPRSIEPLIQATKDTEWKVRAQAAEALGEIRNHQAIDALIAALNDTDVVVRSNAAEALQKITGKDFGSNQKEWLKWLEQNSKDQSKFIDTLLSN